MMRLTFLTALFYFTNAIFSFQLNVDNLRIIMSTTNLKMKQKDFSKPPLGVNEIKQLFLGKSATLQRNVICEQLHKLIKEALHSANSIDKEEESIVSGYSHLYTTLLNLFTTLDILCVAVTGIEDIQFSQVHRVDIVCQTHEFVEDFVSLKETVFTGITTEEQVPIQFSPWHLWSTCKHGGIWDVDVMRLNDVPMLRVGKALFPLEQLVNYVNMTSKLLKTVRLQES